MTVELCAINCHWWFIGLTIIRAGPYVDVDCYTFQSPVFIATELSGLPQFTVT